MFGVCGWMMNDVTVVVVDRSEIFRAGIVQKLACQPGIKLLECTPEHEPVTIVDSHYVNVALLDIDHPGARGLKTAREIIRYYPGTRVIVMSPCFNDDELFETIKVGASAYVDKRIGAVELLSVIRRVHQGEYVINSSLLTKPGVAERVIRQFQEMASLEEGSQKIATPLTSREIQILRYIANGCTNKEAAHRLNISDQTIKNHVSAILRKLNANDRAHAVAVAMYNHWVTLEDRAVL